MAPGLVASVMLVESGGRSDAVSRSGARGLMQLMPSTGAGYGVTNANWDDPQANIRAGAAHLATLQRRYGRDYARILWAYNAGPGAVSRGYMPQETAQYLQKVNAAHRRLYGIPLFDRMPSAKIGRAPSGRRR